MGLIFVIKVHFHRTYGKCSMLKGSSKKNEEGRSATLDFCSLDCGPIGQYSQFQPGSSKISGGDTSIHDRFDDCIRTVVFTRRVRLG